MNELAGSIEKPSNDDAVSSLLLQRGRLLEWLTLACCLIETAGGIITGLTDGNSSLLGFGLDSLIETGSALAVIWRLHQRHSSPDAERVTLRIVGYCFFTLALYLGAEAVASLVVKQVPAFSINGIFLALFSLSVMPLLARAKHKVAKKLHSAVIHADAQQSALCGYLAAIVLAGILANRLFGFWWADPVATLIMIPLIIEEGRRALRGQSCAACTRIT